MEFEREQQFVLELKQYVTDNLSLSKMTDQDLEEKIEELVISRLGNQYCSIGQRVSIVQQIFSSIRGFGLLDSIISDDTITEVMINGPENIFIEQDGRLFKLDKQFESQRKLEEYYRTCITSSGVSSEDADSYVEKIMAQLGMVSENDDTADILNMEVTEFNIKKREDATLANSTMIKRQIVDFMKYRAPINTGLSFLTSLQSFSTLGAQTDLVDKRQSYYEAENELMEKAQEAWENINNYNGTPIVKTENYFDDMDSRFSSYEAAYKGHAKKIIMDLYDTLAYKDCTTYNYDAGKQSVEVSEGVTEYIPTFFINGQRQRLFTDYTTYSEGNQPSASAVKKALDTYHTAKENYDTALDNVLPYEGNVYGLQYVVQTNRKGAYDKVADALKALYSAYSNLRHTVTYANDNVMNKKEKLYGTSSQTYASYAKQFITQFEGGFASWIDEFKKYEGRMQSGASYAQSQTDPSATSNAVLNLYNEITAYKTEISTAKDHLDKAVSCLAEVGEYVRDGGKLDQKKEEWKGAAGADELSGTSLGKQDLAEIESLSTYLNEEEVNKLKTRLQNISDNLGKVLDQIDSYQFFGKKLTDISSYDVLVSLLENQIGAAKLKAVPYDYQSLVQQADSWCSGKFTIGQKLNISWTNQTGTQTDLIKDKLNFYSYLYTHFNTGEVSTNTDKKEENNYNGKELYDEIKNDTSQDASENAEDASSGNPMDSKEISQLSGLPSEGSGGSPPEITADTGNTAPGSTSASLTSMFSGLASSVMSMATDLRDALYISDYILGMFSYDTIEKEFAVKQGGEGEVAASADQAKAAIQTLTLQPINSENNYAYGREVEYIIYGGDNAGNITKAYGTIYGIRLGFNLIYAFTDSSIRDTAFAIATPISAATLGVIPVPLIQAAIIIATACCESALDLVSLRDGESVPLFKNNQTWKCSIQGIMTTVREEVGKALGDAGEKIIDTGVEELTKLLDMGNEELDKFLQTSAGNVESALDAVEDSFDTMVERYANMAIQKFTTLCSSVVDESRINPEMDMDDMAEKVEVGLDAWIKEQGAQSSGDDLAYAVMQESVNIIKQEYVQVTLDELAKEVDPNQDISGAITRLTEITNDLRQNIMDNISEQVESYKVQMREELEESISNGAESLKNTLNSKIEGIFGSSSASKEEINTTGTASLLSFSYSDYLRLFLVIGLLSGEGVLLRTADAIQANMGYIQGDDGYRLTNSAAYVEISATVQVRPTLLALPLFADVEGNPSKNERWYTFEYKEIKGY